MIQFDVGEKLPEREGKELKLLHKKIKVLGIGGAGCNIVSRIYSRDWSYVDFLVCDSSMRTLSECQDVEKMLMGDSLTHGWGTGGDKEIARKVAQEAESKIKDVLRGADLIFVVCSLGKGLGTGASPVFFKIAREIGILSIGFFVLPFSFEGKESAANSQEALNSLWQLVDGALVVPNDVLLSIEKAQSENSSLREVFSKIDAVFENLLQSVESVLFQPAVMGIDFADIKSFLIKGKKLMITTGEGTGEGCVEEAIEKIFYSSAWGEISLDKTKGALLIIKAGEAFKLTELEKIILSLQKRAALPIPITFGVYTDKELSDKLIITLMTCSADTQQIEPGKLDTLYQQELKLKTYDEKDLDVPTFLRKNIKVNNEE
ncbi:hypothetical protein IBX65_02465 [Candidatus Aerophobetes bacterium]|nr:hypothetical protein [Candidatus Aerophobetes bacterium]